MFDAFGGEGGAFYGQRGVVAGEARDIRDGGGIRFRGEDTGQGLTIGRATEDNLGCAQFFGEGGDGRGKGGRLKAIGAMQMDHLGGAMGSEGFDGRGAGPHDHGIGLRALRLGTGGTILNGFKGGFLERAFPRFGKNEDHIK